MRDGLPPSLVFDLFMADHREQVRRAEREGPRRAATPPRRPWLRERLAAALMGLALRLAPPPRPALGEVVGDVAP